MEEGYCLKCREKREMVSVTEEDLEKGRKALRGKCRQCGAGMYKLIMKNRIIPS